MMEAMLIAQAQQRPTLGRRHYDHYVTLLQTAVSYTHLTLPTSDLV